MTAALTLPHPTLKLPYMTVEDYLAGELASDVKHEYLGGTVYMMAGGRNVHHRIASNFQGLMHHRLRGKPYESFNSDTKVRIRFPTHTRFYYPDGMVVCEPNPADDTFQDRPAVIAEVLSDSTRRLDEGEKRDAYLTIPSLKAYLLIDPDRPRVLVYRRGERGFEPELRDGLDAVIPLPEVDIELPLTELYERVDFAAAG